MPERLTTLAMLKDYLGTPGTDSDSFLTKIIVAASQYALSWMSRDSFGVRTYTQNFRGLGKSSFMLVNWPILSVTSVGIGGSFVSASVPGNAGLPGSGYTISDARFGPQTVELYGYSFCLGAPCQVIYSAGFRSSETDIIPATPFEITPSAGGQWIADVSVTIAGIDAVKVASAPTAGQYSVDEWGTYTFAAADEAKTAILTYDYVPEEVSFAVTEMAADMYKRKDRVGLISKSLGGQETVVFSQKDMSDSVRCALQPYANVVPM